MTILLYDYCHLEEKSSRHLNVWKAWHLTIYAIAAVSGILNYVFLQTTMQLVDNNCVLFPRKLAFRTIEASIEMRNNTNVLYTILSKNDTIEAATNDTIDIGNVTKPIELDGDKNETKLSNEVDTTIAAQDEPRIVLDTSRTLFGLDSVCQFAEYMPIMGLILAVTWATFFTMCPGGGYSRSGLQQPWRIVAPALIFAIVMVGLTGHSFTRTNNGLHQFCAAFYNITNTTTCGAVEVHLVYGGPRGPGWGFGGRAGAARAAAGALWAGWACAAALLLARCLAAPDFQVHRTAAYLKDPANKIAPYLKKPRRQASTQSPAKRDDTSIRSEPTATTELVTVSIEHGDDTAPASLQVTPVKTPQKETIEMTTSP